MPMAWSGGRTPRTLTALAESWRPWRGVAAKVLWAYYRMAKAREGSPDLTVNDRETLHGHDRRTRALRRNPGTARQLVVFLHGLGADGNDLIDARAAMAGLAAGCGLRRPACARSLQQAPMGREWFPLT